MIYEVESAEELEELWQQVVEKGFEEVGTVTYTLSLFSIRKKSCKIFF